MSDEFRKNKACSDRSGCGYEQPIFQRNALQYFVTLKEDSSDSDIRQSLKADQVLEVFKRISDACFWDLIQNIPDQMK